ARVRAVSGNVLSVLVRRQRYAIRLYLEAVPAERSVRESPSIVDVPVPSLVRSPVEALGLPVRIHSHVQLEVGQLHRGVTAVLTGDPEDRDALGLQRGVHRVGDGQR